MNYCYLWALAPFFVVAFIRPSSQLFWHWFIWDGARVSNNMCWVHRYCQHAGFGFVCVCRRFTIRFRVHAMIYGSKRPIDRLAIQCVHLAYEHQNYKSAQINVFEQLFWRGYEFGKTMHETFWEKGLDRKLIYWINEHGAKQWQSRGRKLIKKFRFSLLFFYQIICNFRSIEFFVLSVAQSTNFSYNTKIVCLCVYLAETDDM